MIRNYYRTISFLAATAATTVLFLSLGGCEVDLLEPPAGAGPPQPAVIITSADGAKAASQVMQTAELFSTSANLFYNLGTHSMHVISSDPTVTLTAPVPCGDYGQYTYTGTVDETGKYSLELSYALCREEGFQFDGKVIASGTASDLSVTLGGTSYLRLIDYDGDSYSALTGIVTLTGLSYRMTAQTGATGAYVIKPSGSMEVFDYVTLGAYTVIFGTVQYNYTINTTSTSRATSVIVDGSMRQAWTGGSATLQLSGFEVLKTEQAAGASYASGDLSVFGTATYDFGSPTTGLEGILTVDTITPQHTTYATGATNAGTISFSGTGTATAQYNANSSIDVAAAGAAPVSFAGQYYLNTLVAIYGFEQTTPTLMGTTGTVSPLKATGSIWPATMTVTALSSGQNLSCYTDVHVYYYDPADLTTIAWYVDWNIGLVNGCTTPAGIPFEEARDVNGNGTCDAGLDINGADVDLTSGGVEHFTATDLSEGYYVISINNYSCGTDVTNQATIIIGDYLFGTYNCAYTASDGDGTNPDAWCRLADIRVNSDGTADVLSPNASYGVGHN